MKDPAHVPLLISIAFAVVLSVMLMFSCSKPATAASPLPHGVYAFDYGPHRCFYIEEAHPARAAISCVVKGF
jgi:hypothetical protein